MKTLYIDCGMGAAGDMLTAALINLLPNPQEMVDRLNHIGIPDVEFVLEQAEKCGIIGSHMRVKVNGVEEGEESPGQDEHDHESGHEHEDGHKHESEHEQDHDHENDHDDGHEHAHEHDDADENVHEHDHTHEHGHDEEDGHHHSHHGVAEIEHVVKDHLHVPDSVQKDILNVFHLIAEAESHVHNKPIEEIHFHEVGTMDAVADITAVCLIMHELKPDEVVASPIHVGSGQVKCAHGILPVPAPATAYILQGIPTYGGEIRGELCTPTGAALLKYFVNKYAAQPVMKTSAIGYGMGKKDFPVANCLRVLFGETEKAKDLVVELSCNVDDMTAEAVAFATEKILEGGALDVYTIPVGMKKGRPGVVIRALCKAVDKEKIVELIFKHTTTIGIREEVLNRYILDRKIEILNTPYGEVRKKISAGYDVTRTKYEYEDLARIAQEKGCSLEEATRLIRGWEHQ